MPKLDPSDAERRLDRLIALLDGVPAGDAVSILAGTLGMILLQMPAQARPYAWFAVCQSVMVTLAQAEGSIPSQATH